MQAGTNTNNNKIDDTINLRCIIQDIFLLRFGMDDNNDMSDDTTNDTAATTATESFTSNSYLLPGIYHRLCYNLAEIMHVHFILTQWHLAPFHTNNGDIHFIHRQQQEEQEQEQQQQQQQQQQKQQQQQQQGNGVVDHSSCNDDKAAAAAAYEGGSSRMIQKLKDNQLSNHPPPFLMKRTLS